MASPDTAGHGPGRMFNLHPVVVVFALVLLGIHLALSIAGEEIWQWAFLVFGFVPGQISGNWTPSLPGARIWSFFTYALVHASWGHVISNTLWLVVFGGLLAKRLGTWRFLVHAAICAAAGAAAGLIWNWGQPVVYIGASAIVSGQMAAAAPLMFSPGRRKALTPLELLTHPRVLAFFAIFLGVTLFTGATGGLQIGNTSVIAWDTHIGGFLAGLAAFYLLDPGPVQG
jgi:membrane associated rhomboid family serine protease